MPTSQPIRAWLLLCCAMIFAMAIIGAVTRLTESGLSIVEWAPVTGVIPPLTEADWEQAFAAYRQIPQYKLLNQGMTMGEFQTIYFWEWLHRLWGRLIGLVYALPFFWFLARRRIPPALVKPLWGGLALGGLQGAVGWFMVTSGLQDLVYVSHYRLALHLVLALVIYAYLLWLALDLHPIARPPAAPALVRQGRFVLAVAALTITWGAFTAGLRAGGAWNTFPLMDGHILPPEALSQQPLWLNAFANPAMVQFLHRALAILTAVLVCSWAWSLRRARQPAGPAIALAAAALLQIALGIATLLTGVNIILGTLHQAGAILLLTMLVLNLHNLRPAAPAH